MSTIKTDNENLVLHAEGAKDVEIQTNGSTKLTVKSDGNVGIGTDSPAYNIDIQSADWVGARIKSTGLGYAPASLLLESGQSDSRGQGIYHYNSVSKNSWFSGVPYATTSDDWVIAHKLETDGFNSSVAQMDKVLFGVNAAGYVRAPNLPHFYIKGPEYNFTIGSNTAPFNGIITNTGNHFSTSNYRFTAPVNGVYHFSTNIFHNGGVGRFSFLVNGGAYFNQQNVSDTGSGHMAFSMTVYLSANEYVSVGEWQGLGGVVAYMGHSHFSGYLVAGR